MIKFATCNKCNGFNHKELVSKLLVLYPDAKYEVKCQSFCGPGSNEPFVAINEVFITASTIDELLLKVEKHLGDKHVK